MANRSGRTRIAATLLGMVAATGCNTPNIGTTASSFLRHAREDRDPNLRYLAYSKLASPNVYDDDVQRLEATRELAKALDLGNEPLVSRAVICRTLGEIGLPEAREPLRSVLDDRDPIIRSAAARALGKVGGPEDVAILSRVMAADTDPDCRVAAIEGLRSLKKPDPSALIVLADGLQNSDPAIRLASYEALQIITQQDLGPEPGPWKQLADRAAGPDGPEPRLAVSPN